MTTIAIDVAHVTAHDAPALSLLMEREGTPCYCRYWHFTGTNKEWEARCAFDAATNRLELEGAIATGSDEGRGLVARVRGEPERVVGWMKLAPRRSLTKLLARVPYRGLEAADGGASEGAVADVLSIGCFVVDPAMRRTGVATALVRGALAIGARLGATFIEAYPRVADVPLHDGEVWTGPIALYRKLGFEVVRDAPQYPVLRRRVTDGSA